jgi:hypothetical protein
MEISNALREKIIRIKPGTLVGENFFGFNSDNIRDKKQYKVGKPISLRKKRSVYHVKNDDTKVIKAELVDERSPIDLYNEVYVQKKAAKSGYVADVYDIEVGRYESEYFRGEDVGKCWYYI